MKATVRTVQHVQSPTLVSLLRVFKERRAFSPSSSARLIPLRWLKTRGAATRLWFLRVGRIVICFYAVNSVPVYSHTLERADIHR
jgi:hypothetical protein